MDVESRLSVNPPGIKSLFNGDAVSVGPRELLLNSVSRLIGYWFARGTLESVGDVE